LGLQYGQLAPPWQGGVGGDQNAAAITNSGNLEVGENLTLVGGTISSTGQLAAPAGHLKIAAVNGDATVRDGLAQSAILLANNNLILEESQLVTAGDLILLAGDTVRVRDSVETPFIAHAGGNLYIQGNQGIDILALNHPGTPFQSGGALSLISDGVISGDAHFASGGQFAILNLAGEPGDFVSLYDPIISVDGDVILGDYTGASLLIEATGSIKTGNIIITQADISLNDTNDPTDSDIAILTSEPALILRSGVDNLKYPVTPPNLPQPPQPPPTPSEPQVISTTTVYDYDFEGNVGSEWSNTSTSRTPIKNRGFLGEFNSDTVSLQLNNLPEHTQATVTFDLFLIRSWDGNKTDFGPDVWTLSLAGNQTLIQTSFTHEGFTQAYPGSFPNDDYPERTGVDEINTLGYSFGIPPEEPIPKDSVYNISHTFPHTGNSLELNFSADMTEDIDDESWGLDNVTVLVQQTSTPTNLPSSPTIPDAPTFTVPGSRSPGTITTGNIFTLGGLVELLATDDITLNGSIESRGGDIRLHSGGTIDTTAGEISSSSSNNSGAISITANSDINAGEIFASSYGFSGNIDLTSYTGTIAVDGPYIIRSDAFGSMEDLGDTSTKQSGDININARSLSLTNGARVLTGTLTNGVGGNLIVITSESVELSGTSPDGQILTALSTSNAGNQPARNLTIGSRGRLQLIKSGDCLNHYRL
jgi:hypothetical protein